MSSKLGIEVGPDFSYPLKENSTCFTRGYIMGTAKRALGFVPDLRDGSTLSRLCLFASLERVWTLRVTSGAKRKEV